MTQIDRAFKELLKLYDKQTAIDAAIFEAQMKLLSMMAKDNELAKKAAAKEATAKKAAVKKPAAKKPAAKKPAAKKPAAKKD
jgi:hypothetical protein